MKYIKCPCGLSDGHDDKILSSIIKSKSYNGNELIIQETRQCDICNKEYSVLIHYNFVYEELFFKE